MLIIAHRMSPCKIHLLPGTDGVVTVRSSIKARNEGNCTPDFVSGSRHSTSADLTSIIMDRTKRITDIVQPVIIPFSSLCQSDVIDPDVNLEVAAIIQDEVVNFTGDMMSPNYSWLSSGLSQTSLVAPEGEV